jgi:hypothetical protein
MTNTETTAPAASDFVLTETEWLDSEDEALRAEMAEMDERMADLADHADAARRNSSRNPAHWTH